jgi:hypothetical protein
MARGERLQLVQQPGEQLFPFALRAHIERGRGVWQRQQLRDQRDLVGLGGTIDDQRFEPAELRLRRVVTGETGGALKLNDER